MPRTEAGATLTEAHRQGQLRINAQALSLYAAAWPLWTGDEQSFQRLLDVSVPLIRGNHTLSSSLAVGYYEAFRSAEKAGGTPTPRVALPLDESEIRGTLHVTGVNMTRDALNAGQTAQQARQTALVRTSGVVTRLVLKGGRDTIVQSAGEDKRSGGWQRVTSGRPCAFCAMLASRGAVYSADTAAFEAHSHCACGIEPVFPGSALPATSQRWLDLYNAAQRESRSRGTLKRGTQNDALNAFRRSFERV